MNCPACKHELAAYEVYDFHPDTNPKSRKRTQVKYLQSFHCPRCNQYFNLEVFANLEPIFIEIKKADAR